MNTALRLTMEMAVRVRDFLRTKPFGAEKADGVVARFEARVNRALVLIEQQAAGERAVRSSTTTRGELRRKLRGESLRHIARIGRAAAKDKPELAEKIRLPSGKLDEARFRGLARTILAEVQANKDLFLEHGMWEGAVDELGQRLDEYDRVSAEGHAGRAAHTGARAEMKALGAELIAMVRQIEGMMLIRFREDPNLKGAWESARNVAWPVPTAGEGPADGTKQAAA